MSLRVDWPLGSIWMAMAVKRPWEDQTVKRLRTLDVGLLGCWPFLDLKARSVACP